MSAQITRFDAQPISLCDTTGDLDWAQELLSTVLGCN